MLIILCTVRDDNQIRPTPISNVYVGGFIAFYCNSKGQTKWFYNGEKLPHYLNEQYLASILTLNPVNQRSGGIYSCYGSYSPLPFSKHFVAKTRLKVYGKFIMSCNA